MSPTSLLAGRGAVVVGGSRGIGAAVAALLAQHGAAVVVNGRNAAAAQTTADAIVRAGGRAVAHPGSPSDEEAAESLIAGCISEFDGIQILINCAGIPVRANVVCPGAKTPISSGPDYEAQITGLHRRGILDDATMRVALDAPPPEYVAPTYVYLASDYAKDVTGEIFVAAGGFVGRFPRPAPAIIGYRDHNDSPPWSMDELYGLFQKGS